MQLMMALDPAIFGDGVLAVVLEYLGASKMYTYRWRKQGADHRYYSFPKSSCLCKSRKEARLVGLSVGAALFEDFNAHDFEMAGKLWDAAMVDIKDDLLRGGASLENIESMNNQEFFDHPCQIMTCRLAYLRSLSPNQLNQLETQAEKILNGTLSIHSRRTNPIFLE